VLISTSKKGGPQGDKSKPKKIHEMNITFSSVSAIASGKTDQALHEISTVWQSKGIFVGPVGVATRDNSITMSVSHHPAFVAVGRNSFWSLHLACWIAITTFWGSTFRPCSSKSSMICGSGVFFLFVRTWIGFPIFTARNCGSCR
jgi:hypothetical protein